jgi:hypothetical protein
MREKVFTAINKHVHNKVIAEKITEDVVVAIGESHAETIAKAVKQLLVLSEDNIKKVKKQ